VIAEARIMVVASVLLVGIVWTRISHFGRNPKNGGSPPRDKKFTIIVV